MSLDQVEKKRIKKANLEDIKKYRRLLIEFRNHLLFMKQPLGHGTTSEYLQSILKKGLGAEFPENSFANSISLTDLRIADGLLGAYAFARMNTKDLYLKSEEMTGKDIISRYVSVNSLIPEEKLRKSFEKYKEHRTLKGFPVFFVFEGGDIALEYVNESVPSEVEFKEPLDSKNIKFILVPEKHVSETKDLLNSLRLNSKVLAIEILELD